jgi:predicted transcriptional regulator
MDHDHGTAMSGADDFIHLAAEIAAAYVANNSIPSAELPTFLKSIHASLRDMAGAASASNAAEEPAPAPVKQAAPQTPSVPINKTVTPDHIICLEDGQSFRSLKRHLGTAHQMTPQQYREKWGLPADYPMVAPNYAEARSAMAKKIGLGQRRRGKKK